MALEFLIHVTESLAGQEANGLSSPPEDPGMTKKQTEVSLQTCGSRASSSAQSLLLKPRSVFPDLQAPCKVIWVLAILLNGC